MAQPGSAAALLIAGLRAEEQALQEFKKMLATEQEAIIAGNVDQLTALSQSKLQLVERLNRLAAERLSQAAKLGLSTDRNSMNNWATQTGTTAVAAWQAMLTIAEEAHQANKINGMLIQTHLQHNQQALSALLAAANQANLYGPDGQPKSAPAGNSGSRGIIGKA